MAVFLQTVLPLGLLPELWSLREIRSLHFDEDAEALRIWDDGIVRVTNFGPHKMDAEIGSDNEREDGSEEKGAGLLESSGTRIPEEETPRIRDLLGRILEWESKDLIPMKEISSHSWL
ncbi:hypothetical protein BKA64DRAFT_755310 [Cadophora sp. MPI-SDFR-AT-0126]|nr:hypothetical protein BKA64DRAFT_755310 [Leotiomycetes sp. MPI-SDFR-AT-0126]